MDKQDLFIESHKELLELVRWVSRPVILVKRGADMNLGALGPGAILPVESRNDLSALKTGLSKKAIELILKTFCESHGSLL